ncbi:hypothetical protein AAE478_002852 [Parahypoxylon ruwenzoriense]
MSQALPPRDDVHEVFRAASMAPDRLIHLIPDELAAKIPNHILFSYPRTESVRDGFVDISTKCFANAVNRTSWYLESLLGKAQSFESIGYIGANGHLNVLKGANCNIFLRSRGTNADHILVSRAMRSGFVPELEELLEETPVPIYPYTKTFAEACDDPCLVLHTTGSTGLPKPITWKVGILSTYEAWRTIPQVDGYVPTTEIYQQARRAYTSMPLFHTSGLNSAITWSLLLGVTLVYGHPNVVPNSAYTDEMHKYAGVDASLGAPSLYEELSRDPESLERINKLQYVIASGAGNLISQHTRVISNLGSTETACLQRLAPAVEDWAYFYWHPTHSGIQMREYMDGLYELFLVRDPKLVRYQGIFSTFPEIQEWSMSDLYSRHPDPSKPFLYRYTGRRDDVIVLSNGEKISPALMEATLQSSPLVKGAMIAGRGKFQPAALIDLGREPPSTTAERHSLLRALLPFMAEANRHAPAHGQLDQYHVMFADPARPVQYLGQGKIQRHRTYALYEADIEELYRAAEEAIDSPDNDEADGITTSDLAALPPVDFGDRHSVRRWLHALVGEISGVRELKGSDVFFRYGLDSLHVIRITRELRLQIRRAGVVLPGSRARSQNDVLAPKLVYANPTVEKLADAVFEIAGAAAGDLDSGYQTEEQFRSGKDASSASNSGDDSVAGEEDEDDDDGNKDNDRVKTMQSILDKYVSMLPLAEPRKYNGVRDEEEGSVVLLTGSTGSLGSYILDELYNDESVAHIVCLDRSAGAAEKHARTGPKRGLSPIDDPERVEFLKADLSKPQLGLSADVYAWLRETVTHIIHNQWPVNFNWPLPLFEPYIAGVRNLACLAAESDHDAFMLFVSSVSSVGEWKKGSSSSPGDFVPEAPISDLSVAARMGYGESKLVSECLLDRAAAISGVRSACCRVGIVAGPVERRLGLWNKHEYIPSIIISSQALGVYPSTFPARDRVDWLPVDKLSKILLEILRSASSSSSLFPPTSSLSSPISEDRSDDEDEDDPKNPPRTQTFHVVNPASTSWSKDVAAALGAAYPTTPGAPVVRSVPFEQWVDALRASADEAERTGSFEVDRNPAIRLVDFYANASALGAESGPRYLPSARSERASATLRGLGPLGKDWLENWMIQWGVKSS